MPCMVLQNKTFEYFYDLSLFWSFLFEYWIYSAKRTNKIPQISVSRHKNIRLVLLAYVKITVRQLKETSCSNEIAYIRFWPLASIFLFFTKAQSREKCNRIKIWHILANKLDRSSHFCRVLYVCKRLKFCTRRAFLLMFRKRFLL